MHIDISASALFVFLENHDPVLYGKLLEVRDRVTDWLGYIPTTFPHYTRHSVVHSECIIQQVSRILFDEQNQPVLPLSPMEAYILGCAAYFHDAGMVASDKEKEQILKSDEWMSWIEGHSSASKRWQEIQQLRCSIQATEAGVNNFLADVQTRFLLAEFVRRFHHLRSKEIISANEDQFAQFAFGDQILRRTIGDVCVAHGLTPTQLEDKGRFPDRRQIMGQSVNVRFLALALRIGDLLDMSSDRACPLLLNAACPLPPESRAHWEQYQRIVHWETAPDLIEITAECESQDEHRFLKDWCTWLVREIEYGTVLMSRGTRHRQWVLPKATIDCAEPTIRIGPSPSANYLPCNWQFELKPDLVLDRLIGDAYSSPVAYVRELLQNAFDASRCQMYRDLEDEGAQPPSTPTQVDAAVRSEYPIRISLSDRQVANQLSGVDEDRQFLTIEDVGIGMDEDIVRRFLLQVGESFYTTSEFRRNYRFVPTSRFGVGFLSVFSASDRIEIDTYKPTSAIGRNALRLVLTGPRNYLLLQKSLRRNAGTRIELMLKRPFKAGQLLGLVQSWCKRVEFPVIVAEYGVETVVVAERTSDFIREWPVIGEESSTFRIRSFEIASTGLEGALFIFVQDDAGEERWDRWSWSQGEYATSHPLANSPEFIKSVSCFHGITVEGPTDTAPIAHRIDIRDDSWRPSLSRDRWNRISEDKRVDAMWAGIYDEHVRTSNLARGPEGWVYLQRLAQRLNCPEFWRSISGTIPFLRAGSPDHLSLDESCALPEFYTVSNPNRTNEWMLRGAQDPPNDGAWQDSSGHTLLGSQIGHLSRSHRTALFNDRQVGKIEIGPGWLRLAWIKVASPLRFSGTHYNVFVGRYEDDSFISLPAHKTIDDTYDTVVLNDRHPYCEWLLSLATTEGQGVDRQNVAKAMQQLLQLTFYATHYSLKDDLKAFISKWNAIPDLSPNLICPVVKFDERLFRPPNSQPSFRDHPS